LSHGGGAQDAFLAKFDPNGAVIWSTFYGDQGDDVGHTCNLDQNGNVFVCGYTSSQASMASPGAHQSTIAGTGDGFVAKFNSAGQRIWGSYFGGPRVDRVYACAADFNGALLVTGRTDSLSNGSGIATVGCHQPICGLGTYDAFLAKFDSNGVREWGTYYGGGAADEGRAVDTDAQGNIYLAGHTYSTNAIATNNAHQPSNAGGQDGFLAKFDVNGQRLWGTYYGGAAGDPIYGLVVDAQGRVFVSGHTTSSAGIASVGAYQTVYIFADDAFVAQFDGNGVRQWGTYYGDNEQDWFHSLCVDANGDLFAAGTTQSGVYMATSGTFQPNFGGGFGDGLLVKFGLPLGIEGSESGNFEGIRAYPNPTTDRIGLTWHDLADDVAESVTITNALGQVVYECKVTTGRMAIEIPTASLSEGCYLASVRFDSGVKNVRFLKVGN
jgi:hypothetical protein